jgi:hypothetical protein
MPSVPVQCLRTFATASFAFRFVPLIEALGVQRSNELRTPLPRSVVVAALRKLVRLRTRVRFPPPPLDAETAKGRESAALPAKRAAQQCAPARTKSAPFATVPEERGRSTVASGAELGRMRPIAR